MSEEWHAYASDPRIPCRYGSKCYQKNENHQKKFKHPPKNTKRKNEVLNNPRKRPKATIEAPTDVDHKESDALTTSAEKVTEGTPANSGTKEETPKQDVQIAHLPDDLSYHEATFDGNLMKELFLMEMPRDFYKFFECLKTEEAMDKTLSSVNLQLIGPYDLLLGKLPVVDKELYLVHWRFFYDPPEFQAIIKTKGKSEFHMGYFRDSPQEKPVFVASNDSAKDCHIKPVAENIFGAVFIHLENEKKKSPFAAMACQKVMDKVKAWANECGFNLQGYTRKRQIVAKTFHGAGIVVPYNRSTQVGYRKLVETEAAIKKMFTRLEKASTQHEKDRVLSDLQPVITYTSIAMDECDFGAGLEFGIDLFCSGIKELEPCVMSNLGSAYMLLNRDAFGKILEAHLKYRRKGPDMSLLSLH